MSSQIPADLIASDKRNDLAVLQTISSLNYVNGTFNNPFRAAQAFANQPQYWKDFAKIFNSDKSIKSENTLYLKKCSFGLNLLWITLPL